MSFDSFPEDYLRELKEKYGIRRSTEFDDEHQTVQAYFQAVRTRLDGIYTINEVLAVGGTGIVHRGGHNRFEQPIIIKINRPNLQPEQKSMVANELEVLQRFHHPNIIGILDVGEFSDQVPKLSYVVEPFIEGSSPLFSLDDKTRKKSWLFGRLEELARNMPKDLKPGPADETGESVKLINTLLNRMAKLFSQWVDLLSYVHRKNYVYLDVKPENVLVDEYDHLTSIDFGSIEHIDPKDKGPVEVFYTRRYEHPKLLLMFRDKPSSNRVHGSMPRRDLDRKFDHYALGISMLQMLHEIALVREHIVPQLPLYRALHFLATRLLDSCNNKGPAYGDFSYASQVFPGLRDTDYANLAYDNLEDAHRDLEKERGRWNLEHEVPELAAFSKDIVRLVPGFNTVLTPRLRGIIEHPLVGRLKYVTQLGLVSLIYPTADHSRYDHALGSYTYTSYYVKSLFNDLGNPLFRNLVGAEDLNSVLLAALLHDLGQYPLAHDLEEVHERIFKHGSIGADLLTDKLQDKQGRTLQDIIETRENGWGTNIEDLRRIFKAQSKNRDLTAGSPRPNFKTNVLAAIIDGQVDADKADYIIRDSMRCELPYGEQLDLERLLRVLTVAIIPGAEPVLGVYEKGLVSAHAFGLARYQLLATVYWHHTSRIIKSMLQYATAMGLPPIVFDTKSDDRANKELQIRQQLLQFIKALTPPFVVPLRNVLKDPNAKASSASNANRLDITAEPATQAIANIEEELSMLKEFDKAALITWYPGISWTDWLMLRWVANLENASEQSQNLLYGLQKRKLYKRIATFERVDNSPYADLISRLDRLLSWYDRVELCKKLHIRVRDQLLAGWSGLTTTTMSKSEFEEMCDSHLLVLVDIPAPSDKMGYKESLGIVPELKEKSYHPDTRHARDDTPWRATMNKMIDGIAPVRVLCHPEVRNAISAVYARVDEKNPNATLESKIADEISGALSEL